MPSDPRLLRRPLDQVVHVLTFLAVEEAEGPARTAGAAAIGDYMDIAARNEEVTGAGFDEAHRRAEVLDLTRIRRGGNQHGIAAGRGRAINIDEEIDPVAHWGCHIVAYRLAVLRLREVAVGAAQMSGVLSIAAGLARCRKQLRAFFTSWIANQCLLSSEHIKACVR